MTLIGAFMTLIDGRLKKPIIVAEIAQCIGEGSEDVGYLATSTHINPLSKHKPVENPNVMGEMTEAQFKEVDWGFSIPINPINLTAFANYIRNGVVPEGWEEPLGAKNGFVAMGMGWYYIKPISKFRTLDFDRYNHNTRQPLFSTITAPEKVYSDTISMQIDLARGTFWLNDFDRFTTNSCDLGVIVSNRLNGPLYFKSVTEQENGFGKIIFSQEELRQIFNESGDYVCYVVASADKGQNILSQKEDYINGANVWPLPVEHVTINYTDTSSGTSDNVLNFNIKDLFSDEKNITFTIEAYNTTSVEKMAQWVRYKVDVIDYEGNSWTSTTGSPALLQNTAYGVAVPAYSQVEIGEVTIPYSAYRYLTAPWTVIVSLYHGQTEEYNTDNYKGAGTAQVEFEG